MKNPYPFQNTIPLSEEEANLERRAAAGENISEQERNEASARAIKMYWEKIGAPMPKSAADFVNKWLKEKV